MTNKSCKPRLLVVGVAATLLAAAAGVVRAQTLPETSGNLWFYSPSHYPPSRSVPAASNAATIVPTTAHRHVHHANGDVRC